MGKAGRGGKSEDFRTKGRRGKRDTKVKVVLQAHLRRRYKKEKLKHSLWPAGGIDKRRGAGTHRNREKR